MQKLTNAQLNSKVKLFKNSHQLSFHSSPNLSTYQEARGWLNSILEWCRLRGMKWSGEIILTPALARVLLDSNGGNRSLIKANYAQIKTDIEQGRFAPDGANGEPIIVSIEGAMNDGQHRCLAVEATGIAINTFLVVGVTRRSRTTVDQGRNRTVGHYLSMQGVPNANHVARVSALIINYDRYGLLLPEANKRPTKMESEEFALKNLESILASYYFATKGKASFLAPPSVLTFSHYIFKRICEKDAAFFMEKFIEGDDLSSRNPIHTYRKRLIAERGRLKAEQKCELIFRCWNAYREGRDTTKAVLTGSLPKLV